MLSVIWNFVINLITEYTFQRLVVYGKNVDNREKKEPEAEKPEEATPATE